MSDARGVTAEALLNALVRQKARLPAEIGSFLILEACEQLLSDTPCAVSLSTILVSEDGAVSLAEARASSEEVSARSLHRDLTSLLVAAGPAPSAALMRLIEQGPSGGVWSLHQLRDDLEASLVPLNRKASRRVLARLVREVQAEQRAGSRPSAAPTFSALDSELNSFLGGDDEPLPAPAPTTPARERDATIREPIEELGDTSGDLLFFDADPLLQKSSGTRMKTVLEPLPPAAPHTTPMSMPPPRIQRTAPVRAPRSSQPNSLAPGATVRPGPARGLWMGALLIALAGGLVAATFVLRPDALDRLLGRPAPVVESKPAPELSALPRAGDLVVRVAPERSQVLRFVGRGPVEVPHVPLGVAQEFVAVMDGVAPTRVVVPADADWEQTPSGARLEIGMQLGSKQAADAPLELGDSQLPPVLGTPKGALGTLRIVTTPKAAKIYQLVGFAPEARIENLALDQTQEIMAFHRGHAPLIKVVTPSDFVPGAGRPTASLDLTLVPLGKAPR